MNEFAQQNPEGRLHFYMYTDDKASDDKARLGQKQRHVRDFDHLLLETSASKIFGIF